MPTKIIIPGTLPNLNDYIAAERRNKHIAAALKRQTEHTVMLYAKSQLHGLRFTSPVRMSYTWYEPNRRRDKDNVSSFGRKCIQDALVRAGILKKRRLGGDRQLLRRLRRRQKSPQDRGRDRGGLPNKP